jgi:hypothetical protein
MVQAKPESGTYLHHDPRKPIQRRLEKDAPILSSDMSLVHLLAEQWGVLKRPGHYSSGCRLLP